MTKPFLLFQKGVKIRKISQLIIYVVTIGITPSDILALWHHTKCNYHVPLNLKYRKWQGAKLSLSQDAFNDSLPLIEIREFHEGMKMVTACLVDSYFSKEAFYAVKMAQTEAKFISADHPFKLSANIGIMLQGMWIKLYDALLIVVNEKGKLCIVSIPLPYSYVMDL